MNNLSKLTALLLALLMAFAAPMAAVAETITTEKQYEEHVSAILAQLYDTMMDGATYEELLEATKTMSRTEIENFLARLLADGVDDDLAEYDDHIAALFETYLAESVDPVITTNFPVGPLKPPVTGTETLYAMARSTTAVPTTNTTGMSVEKDVNWDQTNSKGTITIDAFATGSTVTKVTDVQVPTDIVLVLDLSNSMNKQMSDGSSGGTDNTTQYYSAVDEGTELDIASTYYVKVNVNNKTTFVTVKWCATCNAWTHGCNHLSSDETKNTKGTAYVFGQVDFYTATRRLAVLQAAVENFAYTVFEMARGADDVLDTDDDVQHRIAVVGFNSTTYLMVNGSRDTTSQNPYINMLEDVSTTEGQNDTISNLDNLWQYTAKNTNTHLGIAAANSIFANNPIPSGTTRNRVMIVFTDGAPQDYDTPIYNAKTTKNDHGATVYTIGVIQGAEPSDNPTLDSTSDINKLLHFISSNYPNATSLKDYGTGDYTDGYYLATNDADELNKFFQTIASKLPSGGASISLSSSSVVKDVLTDTFKLPNGASSIRVYMAKCTKVTNGTDGKTYEFDDDVTATTDERVMLYPTNNSAAWCDNNAGFEAADFANVSVTIDGQSISVIGFDFSKYYCGLDSTEDNGTTTSTLHPGVKLIIEIDIVPVDGFLGGNNVETNVTADSGVFKDPEAVTNKDATVPMPDAPNVNVKVVEIEIIGNDQHIYLSNNANLDALLKSFSTKYTVVSTGESYTVDGIKNAYADVEFVLRDDTGAIVYAYRIEAGEGTSTDEKVGTWYIDSDKDGNPFEDSEAVTEIDVCPLLLADTTYTISYTVKPTSGYVENTYGAAVTPTTDTLYSTVHVHTPTLTFEDSVEEYLDEVHTITNDLYYTSVNYKEDATTWSPHTCEVQYTDDDVEHTITATYYEDGTYTKTETYGSTTVVTTVTKNASDTTKYDKTVTVNGVVDDDESRTAGDYGYTILGTKPEIALVFESDPAVWQKDTNETTGVVNTTLPDVPVNVTVFLNGEDYTAYVPITRLDCDHCDHEKDTELAGSRNPDFIVHIIKITGSLTITKVCANPANTEDTFIFTVTGDNLPETGMQVVLKAGQSVTIPDLLVGDYTVTEDLAWSWRYEEPAISVVTDDDITVDSPSVSGVTVPGAGSVTVTFTNSVKNPQWIDGSAYADNEYNGTVTRKD